MKSILLNADNDRGWPARYRAALAVARTFVARIRCVQTTPFADTGEGFFGYFPYPEVARELDEIGRQHRARAEEQLRGDGVEWDWQRVMETQAQTLIRWSRLSDVTVVSTGGGPGGEPRAEDLALAGTVAIHARGPILAVPSGLIDFDPLGTALIAWNGSPEAASALRSALPLLKQAEAVILVAVGEGVSPARAFTAEDAIDYLRRHAVACNLRAWNQHDGSVSGALLDAAAGLDADYIVAGAYGHTRLRESVLGGATRTLLTDAPIPLIMAH